VGVDEFVVVGVWLVVVGVLFGVFCVVECFIVDDYVCDGGVVFVEVFGG